MHLNKFCMLLLIAVPLANLTASADKIHDAVQSRDVAQIRQLISADKHLVNATTASGMTPLHYAAANDFDKIALFLIASGADHSAKTVNGVTPLQLAVRKKATKVVRVLITKTPIAYTSQFIDISFEQGRKALETGELETANDMIVRLLREDPGNEHINFALGMICSSRSDFSRANMAFERVLQINKRNDRARLELARAYIATGQLGLAREQLRTVQLHNPPPNLQNIVDVYLTKIRKSIKRWSLTTRIDTAAFNDDNVNVGPNRTIIDIAPVIVGSTTITNMALSKESKPAESTGYSAMLTLSGGYDIGMQGNWMLVSDGAYYQSWLESEYEDYEYLYGLFTFGAKKMTSTSVLKLNLTGTHISSGGNALMNMYGINPSYLSAIGQSGKTFLSSALTAEIRDYDELSYRDGSYYEIDEELKWFLGRSQHNVTAGITLAHDNTDSDVYKYFEYGANLSGELNLPWNCSLYAKAEYARSDYDKKEDLAPEKRSDDELRITAGISKIINSWSGLDINHQFTDNNSTFQLYEYDRNITTLSVFVMF